MKRSLGIVGFAMAVIAGGFALYKAAYPTYTHRYRLTIAIEVDGKVHRGSSVVEVSWIGQPKLGDAPPFIPSVKGQATLVDLGPRGAIVAALHPGVIEGRFAAADFVAIRAFGLEGGLDAYRAIAKQSGWRDLAPDNMPLLIWFRDVADPATAQATTTGHIPGLFGPGSRLVEARVEMTGDPIVIDIDRKLPWYRAMAARQKTGLIVSRPGQFQLVDSMLMGADS